MLLTCSCIFDALAVDIDSFNPDGSRLLEVSLDRTLFETLNRIQALGKIVSAVKALRQPFRTKHGVAISGTIKKSIGKAKRDFVDGLCEPIFRLVRHDSITLRPVRTNCSSRHSSVGVAHAEFYHPANPTI